MKYSELEKKLRVAGCRFYKNGGRHPIWFSPITGLYFEMSYHQSQEVKSGALRNIIRASGVKF